MTMPSERSTLPVPVQATVLPYHAGEPAPAGPPAILSAPPSMEGLVNALRQRWWVVLSLALAAALLGGGVTWMLVPARYSVQTLLHIAPRASGGYESETEFLNYQRTQTAVIHSFPVILATLEKPGVAALSEVREHDDAPEWLNKGIKTDTLLGPEIIRVTLDGDNGEDLAVLLNELVSAYLRTLASKEESKIQGRIKQLQGSFQSCSDQLRDKRLTLQNRERELDIPSEATMMASQQTLQQQVAALQNQAIQLKLEAHKIEVELIGNKYKIKDPSNLTVAEIAIADELKLDPVVQQYNKQLVTLDEEMQKYQQVASAGLVPAQRLNQERHRAQVEERLADYKRSRRRDIVARLRQQTLAQTQDKILELERLQDLNREQQKEVETQIQRLETKLASVRNAAHPSDPHASDIVSLRDEVAQMELVLKKIGDEMGSLQSQLPVTPRVTQMEVAKVPQSRKRDKQVKFSLVAGLGLCGLVFIGMALLEFRFRRVYAAGDVEQGLGLTLLGTLPALPPQARQLLPGPAPSRSREQVALAEAIDGIRTRVLHAASRGEQMRVIMVASAISGEGKTSLSTQLAASLARSGKKTLLLDCDLRNPAAHMPFGLSLAPGFSEVLRGETALSAAIQATPIPGLSLLSAGQCDRQALQALSQADLGRLFAQLKEEHDIIIIDVCPVLPVTDALLIGRHVDGVLFSVLRSVSRLPAVYAALQRLQALDIRLLGAVVLGETLHTYGIDRYLAQIKEG